MNPATKNKREKMIIKVKVKPSSAEQKIVMDGELYVINLKSPATDNKANIELLKMLKKYFKKEIKIKSGKASRNKLIEVTG